MSLPWLIALTVGLAALGAGWLVFGYYLQISSQIRRQRQFNRLEKLSHGDDNMNTEMERMLESQSPIERLALLLTGQLHTGAASEPAGEERVLLAQAGYRGIRPLIYFQATRLGLTAGLLLIFVTYALVAGTTAAWLKVVVAGSLAYLVPKYLLKLFAHQRVRELANELPMFVDYLHMMHGAGASFEQAIILFAEERRIGLPVLASEFSVVRTAIKSGRTRAEALQMMAEQIDLPELRELVALINDSDRYGAGLQEPLKRFAIRLTEKRRFEMQDYVGKLATRMVVVMVLFLLPALLIVTAGPGFLALSKALAR